MSYIAHETQLEILLILNERIRSIAQSRFIMLNVVVVVSNVCTRVFLIQICTKFKLYKQFKRLFNVVAVSVACSDRAT